MDHRKQAVNSLRAASTPTDKPAWRPMDAGRSILDMVIECGAVNMMSAQTLSERAVPEFSHEAWTKIAEDHDTLEKATELLQVGTDKLAKAIEGFPAEAMEETILLPYMGGMTKTFSEFMMMPIWNLTYHTGQIAYIQTLYGDKEMH